MTLDLHVSAYESRLPLQTRFTKKLELLIRDLLVVKNQNFHIIESRTKDVHSFRDKVSRPTKSYVSPVEEITDLSGIRIITYYQDEADRIGQLIESEFSVDVENSLRHQPEGAEFGYTSRHYVIQLPAKRTGLPEWSELAGLKAEVQVRTVLQHAWAAVSHKLQYKREDDVPIQLRRKLFRLSALFELADDEFISLRSASGEVLRSIKTELGAGNQGLPIDIVSLSELLESSPAVAEAVAIAAEIGFVLGSPDEDDADTDESSAISDLVHLCFLADIQTVGAFDSMMELTRPWIKDYLNAQFNSEGMGAGWYVSAAFICQLLIIRYAIDKIRVGHLLILRWDRFIANRVFQIAQSFHAEA